MSALIAPLLQRLVEQTESRALRWEATAEEDTFIATQPAGNGTLVYELALEEDRDGWSPVLVVRRLPVQGDAKRMPLRLEDSVDSELLQKLWGAASSAEYREFIQDVLDDLGLTPDPGAVPRGILLRPPGEDPFGDQ